MGIYKAVQFNTTTNLIDTTPQLDPSLVYPLTPPAGLTLTANGTLINGSLVALQDNGGNLQAIAATSAATCGNPARPAVGFVLSSYTNGQPVTVFLAGLFTASVIAPPPQNFANATNIGNLVYLAGDGLGSTTLTPPLPTSVWAPGTVYTLGQTIIDSNGNLETVTTPGTSGSTEPLPTPPGPFGSPPGGAWATVCGGTTTDGFVTWTMGPAPLEQVVGTIVYYNSATNQCTVDFQPLLNIGDVTSVGLAMPPDFAVGGSPILTAGTLQVTWLPQNANTVHAGPTSGPAAVPTWRALVAADLPAVPFNLLATGVNTTATMTVGPGATLTFSVAGSPAVSGIVNANELYGVTISGVAPTTGQALVATGATSAAWETIVNNGTANQIAYYAASGDVISGDSLLTDNGTTLSYTGTSGVSTTNLALTTLGVITWNADTGLSRASAGIIDVGTGAQGSKAGSINLTNLTASGVISLANGTVSAPALEFSNSTGTGLYLLSSVGSPAANGLGIAVNGVLIAQVWDDGFVFSGHLDTASTNNDACGSISSVSGTTVSKTFSNPYVSTPIVVVTPTTNAGAFYLSSVSKTGFTVTYANSGAQTFNYHVIGNPS